jgi:F0F1-type ATP synthase alpha subunit
MAEAYLNKIGYKLHKDLQQYNNEELFTQYSTRLNNNTAFYICKRACGQTQGKRSQWKTEEQLK